MPANAVHDEAASTDGVLMHDEFKAMHFLTAEYFSIVHFFMVDMNFWSWRFEPVRYGQSLTEIMT